MRSEYFLALPFAATLFNLFFAITLNHSHSKVHAQAPGVDVGLVDRCVDNVSGESCFLPIDDLVQDERELLEQAASEKEEEDPQLKLMPGTDFKAYVRADVATFYGQEPGTMEEPEPSFNGQACKFVNMSPDRVSVYWSGPNEPVFNANLGPWESGGTACFPTHRFIVTKPNQPDDVFCDIEVVKGTSTYYCDPFTEVDHTQDARARGTSSITRSLEELSDEDRASYDAHVYNLQFGERYKDFTGGSEWLTMYPRNPPRHQIWRADYYGQEHHVQTRETHFVDIPKTQEMRRLSVKDMQRNETAPVSFAEYRAPGELNLTIKALSCAPRAFSIEHFLSDEEADHILELVQEKNLARSTTSGHLSDTRTSTNTWIPRHSDPVVDAVYRRVADVLRLDEALLRHREPGEHPDRHTDKPINEELQIVHYEEGQEYTAHHDFSYPDGTPDSPSRSINLCMYLNNVRAGGQTSFPRWRNGETSDSLDVTPEKGKAMIFYMVNPDGNLDDLTQHAALPVVEGEKWFANLWIWDPVRL